MLSSRDIMSPMRTLVPLFIAAAVSIGTFALVAQAPPGGAPKGKGGPPKNLKILTADNYRPLMTTYVAALGAMNCDFCHEAAPAGKDGDGNPRKLKARMMIQMVMDINKSFGDGKEHVTCYTCHRGSATPLTAAP
jgi:hypothetical protein